jgi:hypothetical protein
MNTEITKYAVGTKFIPTGKIKRICTVVDMLTTYSLTGEIVKIRYVAAHDFCGQQVLDFDVCAATIAMGLQ